MLRYSALRAFVPILLLAAGCGGTSTGPQAASPPPSPPASVSPPPSPPATVVLGDYDASHDAKGDVRRALAAAKKDGKPVLVDFGADWCADCMVLGRLAAKPQVQPALARFHVVSVDVGKFDKNLDVARNLTVNLQTSGIPALVVLAPTGKVRTVTNDGSFENARTMTPAQVTAFLTKWQ